MQKLWLSIAHTSGAKIYSLIVGAFILALTARWLGPEGRGTIAAINTLVGMFSLCSSLSLGQVAFYRATKMQDRPWLGSTLGSLLFLVVVLTLVGWGIAAFLYFVLKNVLFNNIPLSIFLLGFLSLPLAIWAQYASPLLMAINKITVYNKAQILGKTLNLVGVSLLLFMQWGIYGVMISALLYQITVALFSLIALFKYTDKPIKLDIYVIKELIKGGGKLHLNAIGNFINTSLDILMINYYRGLQETGYYQFAANLANMLLVIPDSASIVLFSKVAELGPDKAWKYQRKVLFFLTSGMTLVAISAALLAPWAIPLVVGSAFGPSIGIFQWLLVGVCGMTFSRVMASQWMGRGMFWQATAITVTVATFNASLNFLLIPKYGMYGAVWTMLGTYLIAIFGNLFMAIWVNKRFKTYAS